LTEEDARAAVKRIVGDAAMIRLDAFAERLRQESERQNLVARGSLDTLWERHFLDSAQLITLAGASDGTWIDVGTGAGFPGLVVALASDRVITMVEPRRMRAAFLQSVIDEHALAPRVSVAQVRVERLQAGKAAIISARAVASLTQLFEVTAHLVTSETVYLLPKGQSATTELTDAQQRFQGLFHVEQSITDPSSGIIRATNVKARR
jgi:16S rRNA (guanine527-N7)-methyltransferase